MKLPREKSDAEMGIAEVLLHESLRLRNLQLLHRRRGADAMDDRLERAQVNQKQALDAQPLPGRRAVAELGDCL